MIMENASQTHIHKWRTSSKPDMLVCSCDTISALDDVLHNVALQSAFNEKVKLLGSMMFNHELKKAAHEKYYAWLKYQNSTESRKVTDNQTRLI